MVKPKGGKTPEKKAPDWKQAYIDMRRIANHALDLADRCHGGHSYTSHRSTEAKACCEVRMQIDDMKKEYVKVSTPIQV
jgi:hypothetical protein